VFSAPANNALALGENGGMDVANWLSAKNNQSSESGSMASSLAHSWMARMGRDRRSAASAVALCDACTAACAGKHAVRWEVRRNGVAVFSLCGRVSLRACACGAHS